MVHGQSGSERSRALSTSPLRVPLLHSGESLEETPARGSSAFVGGAAAADEHSVYVRLPHWTLYKCVQPQTTCTPLSLSRARAHTRPLMSDPITFANCESCCALRSVLCALAGALSLSLDGRRKCTLGLIDKQRKISLGRIVSGSLISCSSEETMSRRLEIAVSIRNETKGNRVRARLRMLKGESYAKVRK